MTDTQPYYLAYTAREKLSSETSRTDHDLRLIVGHANLLGSLLVGLVQAVQDQEPRLDETICMTLTSTKQRYIQGQIPDTIVEDLEENWLTEDADSSDFSFTASEYSSDEESEEAETPVRRLLAHTAMVLYREVGEFEDEGVEEYEDGYENSHDGPALHASQSHGIPIPLPEHYSGDSFNDDPPSSSSPSAEVLPSFSEKRRQNMSISSF